MMHGFFRAGPVLALALTTSSLVACLPGQLDTSGWLPDGGRTTPPLPDPPDAQQPPVIADARPPDTAVNPPPPPPDGGAPDTMTAPPPDGPIAAESWCTNGTEITNRILQPKCGACHSSATKAGGLDLITAGAKTRLIDVPSTICQGQSLVTMTPEVGGHFFVKLEQAICGDRMPPAGLPTLSAAEIQCLKAWIDPP
jgi:hypothetical protein